MHPTPPLAALLIFALPLAAAIPAQAAAPILPLPRVTTEAELTGTIRALDTRLFNAYNHGAEPGYLDQFAALFTPDVEFYHDQPGATTFGLPALTAAIQKNVCGKVTRELLPGTLHVYPMHGYDAIEMGLHRFLHTDCTAPAGEADLIHLWLIPGPDPANPDAGGQWKLARVLSYDHNAAAR